jgi:phosphoglycerate dehydrogenase-like enzyme
VQSSSAGVELLLFPEMLESPVVLTNGQGLYAEALGEFVLFCVLSFAKDFRTMEENRRERRWRNYNVAEAQGQTIGIVGLGGTGRVIARMAKAFGMRVIATKRNAATGAEDNVVDAVVPVERWHELLGQSDFVVNALPVTPQTMDMFNEEAFRAMKPSARFINVGRGKTVDEDALLRALKEGWIAGAGLDVFKREPLPADSEFYDFPNVIVSPHCADMTPSYPEKSARLLAENLRRYLEGEPLLKVVDKSRGY